MSVSTDSVLDQIAAALHLAGNPARDALASFWPTIVPWALLQAQTDRLSGLAGRGLTADQAGAWIGTDSFDQTQAAYWALVKGAGIEAVDLAAAKLLDLREWLKTATLLDENGNLIEATGVVVRGNIAGGWVDVQAREPSPSRLGFVDPSTGRLRAW